MAAARLSCDLEDAGVSQFRVCSGFYGFRIFEFSRFSGLMVSGF